MKTFSRLNLLTLLFLGIVLMLVGGTTDVYAQETSLQVTGDTGTDKVYDVGDRMETVFTATDADGEAVEGADLTITHVGLTDVTISNDGTTDEFGEVVVRGQITSSCTYVSALWPEGGNDGLRATASLGGCIDIDPSLWVDSSVDDHKLVEVGDEVTVKFFVDPPDEIPLHVSVKNVEVISIWGANDHHAPILPSNYTTSRDGVLVVRGIFTRPGDAFIQARWDDPLPHSDILTSTAVFEVRGPLPPTIQVFNKYKETFKHPDVHEHFPDVLRAFKKPEIRDVLNSVVIHHFVRDPEYIRAFSPDVDASIITLLTTDDGFRTLFEDEQFQKVLQNPARIDELVKLIIEAQPLFRPEILALEVNFSSITGRNPDSGAPQGTVTVSAYTTAQRTAPEIASIQLSTSAGRNWEVRTSTEAGGRKRWSVVVDTRTLPDTITRNNPGARNAALDNRQYTVRAVAIGVDGTQWPSNLTVRFSVDNVDDVPPVGPTNIISVADADGPVEANEDGSYTVGGLIDKYDETLTSPIATFTVQPTAQPATYDSVYLVQTDSDGTEASTQGSSGQLEFTVDVGTLENGTYMFYALTVDAEGNIQTDLSPKITVHIENYERPAPEIVAITVDPAAETNPDSGAPQGTIVLNGHTLGERSSPPITSMRFEVKRQNADDFQWKEVGTTDFVYNAAETAAGDEETASIHPDQTYQKWSVSIDTIWWGLEDTIDAESLAARNVSLDTNPYVVRAIAVSAADGSETVSSIGVKSTFSVDNVDDVAPLGPTNIVAVADVAGPIDPDADGNYTVGGIVDETVPSPIAAFTVEPTAHPSTYASIQLVQVDADGNETMIYGEVGMLDVITDVGMLGNGAYMIHALAVDEFGNVQTDESPQITVYVENRIEAQPQREPRMFTIVSGDLQKGEPQTALGNPLVVLVRDQYGNVLSGVDVAFRVTKGDGSLSRPTARTGRAGRAETTLTLGAVPGIHQVEAYVLRFPSLTQTFTAVATAVREVPSLVAPTTLSIVSGNHQSGEVGKSLVQPFVIGVLDQDGKPLQGIQVTFAVTAGNGQLSATRQITNVYGQARTTLTLGARAVPHSVTARAAGITQAQTFTATATAPPPPPEPEPVVSVPPSTDEPDQQLPPVVYWIEEGAIFRLDGGKKQALVEPSDGWTVTSLAMDMEKNILYWTERQTGKQIGRIWSGDLNDRNARELQSITAVPEGIVVDAENDRLYWTNDRGKIQRTNVDGSNFKGNFIEDLGSPHHIALDSATGDIYWTVDNEAGSWSIWRAPLVGNITKEEIVTGLDQLGGIAVANDKLYWTEGGKISCANKRNGSGVKTLILLRGSVPLGLAVDEAGRRLYWTDNGGNIRSLNLDKPIENEVVVRGSSDTPAVAIALGRSSSESIPASPAAPSTIAERSVESALLANYPNPFNPETWIPYQLSAAGDVSISIYSVNGHLVRRLELGHQVAGVYQRRSRAAYWDGRNEFGERVASGLYFYTLTADDFTATRKMLIRK